MIKIFPKESKRRNLPGLNIMNGIHNSEKKKKSNPIAKNIKKYL